VKHPILGDPIYGASYAASDAYLDMLQSDEDRLIQHGAPRLMLHAQSLEFSYGSQFYLESKVDFVSQKSLITAKELRVFNGR